MKHLHRPASLWLLFLILTLTVWKLFIIGVVIMSADVVARHVDYKSYRHLPENRRVLDAFAVSWCSRGVAKAIWPVAPHYYRAKGYRWYHLLPDGSPGVFFTKKFWKSALGFGKDAV